MCLVSWTSTAQTKVEFELYLGQSVVDYICVLIFLRIFGITLNYGLLILIDLPLL